MNNTEKSFSKGLDILFQTHKEAAARPNASTEILTSIYEVTNGNYLKSITAAIQTFGEKHAPIKETYKLIRDLLLLCKNKEDRESYLCKNYGLNVIIPGFGSHFVKNQPDPILENIADWLYEYDATTYNIANEIRVYLYGRQNIDIYPNLAFYTADLMLKAGMNINLCESFMLEARLSAWNEILIKTENGKTRTTSIS